MTVVSYSHSNESSPYWVCKCECGEIRTLSTQSFKRVVSCGCYRRKIFMERITSHQQSKNPVYKVWHAMMQRCYNKNCKAYKNYGGRGISVEKRWQDFNAFFEDFGSKKPVGGTIDRIDNDGNYSRENCQWSTIQKQQTNKRNTKQFVYNGITHTKASLFRLAGIPKETGYFRTRGKTLLADIVSVLKLENRETNDYKA